MPGPGVCPLGGCLHWGQGHGCRSIFDWGCVLEIVICAFVRVVGVTMGAAGAWEGASDGGGVGPFVFLLCSSDRWSIEL